MDVEEEKIDERFRRELEFVCSLSKPAYLGWLANSFQDFDSEEFVNYLRYLLYWNKPEYAKFIVWPHALYFLELLQSPAFRKAIKSPDYLTIIHDQQFFYWRYHREEIMRKEESKKEKIKEEGKIKAEQKS